MKQVKRSIAFHCAAVICIFFIRNFDYRLAVFMLSAFVSMIVGGAETIRFNDFIMEKYPLVYYECKSYNGNKRAWLWDWAEEHCQESVTNDRLLLENCRRFVYTCKSTYAFWFIAPIVFAACLEIY